MTNANPKSKIQNLKFSKICVNLCNLWIVFAVCSARGGTVEVDTVIADEVQTRTISYPRPFPDDGLLYYSFKTDTGTTVLDASGNGRDGTATQCAWTNAGRYAGGAMKFNGGHANMGSWVSVANSPDFPAWGAYTVSVWFRHDGGGTANLTHKIVDKTSMMHDWFLYVHPTFHSAAYPAGRLGLSMYEGGTSRELIDGSMDYRDTEWHHVAVVRDGTLGQLWVDGALKASTNNMVNVYSASAVCVGSSHSPDSNQRASWSGLLDEVRIYGRALSPSEIGDLFSAGALPVPEQTEPETITIASDLSVEGGLTVSGEARFLSGIRYVKPLGDLSSGIYTNSAPTP